MGAKNVGAQRFSDGTEAGGVRLEVTRGIQAIRFLEDVLGN